MGGIVYQVKEKSLIDMEYVHSVSSHVMWDKSTNWLRESSSGSYTSSLSKYLAQLREMITVQDTSGVNVLANMSDEVLVQVMQAMAEQANAAARNQQNAAMDSAILTAESGKSFLTSQSAFANGSTTNDFTQFMNGILQGLQLVSSLTPQQWQSFQTAYAMVLKQTDISAVAAGVSNLNTIVSSWNLQEGQSVVQEVTRLLANIPQNMVSKGSGGYNIKQMSSSLNNIMKKTIGEYQQMISKSAFATGKQKVETALVGANKSIYKKGDSLSASELNTSTVKTDIYRYGSMNISLKLDGQDQHFTVIGQLNSSVKWYNAIVAGKGHAQGLNNINIASNTNYLAWIRRIFGNSHEVMYGAYNTLAFNKTDTRSQENYRILRSSTIRDSLNLFLAGKGTSIVGGPSGAIDFNSFLVLNGKYYSMATIVAAVDAELKKKEFTYGSRPAGDLVYLNVSNTSKGISNAWESPDENKFSSALVRSGKAKAEMAKFGLSVHINIKTLENTVRSLGVQPII